MQMSLLITDRYGAIRKRREKQRKAAMPSETHFQQFTQHRFSPAQFWADLRMLGNGKDWG